MSRPIGRGPRPRGGASSGSSSSARGGIKASALNIRGPPSSASTPRTQTPTPSTNSGIASSSTGIIGHTDPSGRITSYTSPDDQCPSCKTDRFLNPKLKLLISPCYHKLCTSCIDRIWSLGPAPCPECGNVCRKSQFGSQTFADLGVEREIDVRKRIARLFTMGKKEEDCENLREWNDYLEEVEQITYNLIHGVELETTNARLAVYEQQFKSKSSNGGAANGKEEESNSASNIQLRIDEHLASCKKNKLDRHKRYAQEDIEIKKQQELEIMRVLENGNNDQDDDDVIEEIKEKYKIKRQELQLNRDMQEEETFKMEEVQRLQIINSGLSKSKNGTDQPQAAISLYHPDEWQLFTGSKQSISDGTELLSSFFGSNVIPPKPLSTTLNHNTTTSQELTPYDPWTSKTYMQQMDNQEKLKLNASGWDAAMPWVWQAKVAVQTLSQERM
ncbi:unnamed protein product [Sympodiomycopsis kandeliae]